MQKYQFNETGLEKCTLFNGTHIICNIHTDEVLYRYVNTAEHIEFRLCRTNDEQFYIYQKGKYSPIISQSTFESPDTYEIVQLINASEINPYLEELGVITEDTMIMLEELS